METLRIFVLLARAKRAREYLISGDGLSHPSNELVFFQLVSFPFDKIGKWDRSGSIAVDTVLCFWESI